MAYNFKSIEEKWQKYWSDNHLYRTDINSDKEKLYLLVEFPYPSGAGLHVGHVKSYTAMDVIARKKRSEGKEVLYPMGWDAFGLPTENYAIKTGIHPKIVTRENIDNFRRQLQACGFSFDWEREVDTTDPSFYKWSQWIFLKLYEKGLAYKKPMLVNWCPKDKCVLANEEVVDGCCERCGTPATKRDKEQWMLAITKYAERLDKDLDDTIYLPKIKAQQRNWIGMSDGSEIEFKVKTHGPAPTLHTREGDMQFTVFTTRADTIFGCTYCVLAPEHALVDQLIDSGIVKNGNEVIKYREEAKLKKDFDRSAEGKEKTGVRLDGVVAINPSSGEELPLFIADYVLPNYGTGAIMAVPAHDERDYAFAEKFNIDVKEVVKTLNKEAEKNEIFTSDGVLINSGAYNGMSSEEARKRITLDLGGKVVKKSKLRDWVFARQRYWGEPIPIVYDENNVMYPVAESEFPIVLPEVERFEPTDNGESPLALAPEWVNVRGFLNDDKHFVSIASLGDIAYNEHEPLDINDSNQADAYVSNVPIVERNNVACIIKHPTEDKYLLAKWKQVNWSGFVTGGIENGATDEDTARNEVTEETGYSNIKSVEIRDFASHGLFYHVVKKQNRFAHYKLAVVQLADLNRNEVSQVEKAIADFEWVDANDVESTLTRFDMKSLWQYYTTGTFDMSQSKKIQKFRRETDTMPQWAGSSWYFMRYIDPHNDGEIGDKALLAKWLPVDWYNGGMEHTTLHLLYSRFWYKFLYDIGLVPTSEPYYKRTSQGMILGAGGVKMSKSLGNVVNPDDIIHAYGADVLRLYEMFMGPFDQAIAWDEKAIIGVKRFLDRVEAMSHRMIESDDSDVKGDTSYTTLTNQTIKAVTDGIDDMGFNTCISAMMIWLNEYEKVGIDKNNYKAFIKLLSPFAPHLTEEIWQELGGVVSIHQEPWPIYDENKLTDNNVNISVQIGGKMRGLLSVPIDSDEASVRTAVEQTDYYVKYMHDNGVAIVPKKVIFVKNKIINFVI